MKYYECSECGDVAAAGICGRCENINNDTIQVYADPDDYNQEFWDAALKSWERSLTDGS